MSVDTICLFVTHLIEVGSSANSIASILSAISYFHKLKLSSDPTQAFPVKQLILAAQKTSKPMEKRLPIDLPLLNQLISSAQNTTNAFEGTLLSAMLSVAFCLGLCLSEYTLSCHNLQFSQITLTENQLKIRFLSYKHSSPHQPPHVVDALKKPFCPVLLLRNYIKVRGTAEGPLFLLGGEAVSGRWFNFHLKQHILNIGLDPKAFSSHSLRIGAANSWADKNLSELKIKQLGRWKANALPHYLRSAINHSF